MPDDRDRPARTLALCAAMQAVGGGLGWSLVPALMPEIARDLHVSHAAGGVIWGAASLGIAVAAPFGGALVDRFGARRVAGFASIFGAFTCAARAFVTSSVGLGVAMIAFGLHVGLVAPAIPKALAGDVPLRKLGRANGLALLAYTATTAAAIAFAPTLSRAVGGFRTVMALAAVAMAVVSVVWLALARDRSASLRHASLRDVVGVARSSAMRKIAAMHFLLFGGYLALLGILPRALLDAGVAPTRVATSIATWLLVAAAANAMGPSLSDRFGRRKPILVFGAIVSGSALFALAIAPHAAVLPLLSVAAIGGGAFAPLLLTMPAELEEIGPARAGAALGLLMLVGQIGGFLLPTIAGAALQSKGFAVAVALLAVAHLCVVIPALRMPETGRAKTRGGPLRNEAAA
jgi:NNP family nitrate/nitrite transporter-like MFS transporter